jgi:hypothetical protein
MTGLIALTNEDTRAGRTTQMVSLIFFGDLLSLRPHGAPVCRETRETQTGKQ